MPKWHVVDAPRGRRFYGHRGKRGCRRRRRRVGSEEDCGGGGGGGGSRFPDGINHTFGLYRKKEPSLSRIVGDEREFFVSWVRSRHIEDQHLVLALTYWMRVRADLATFFLVRDKRLYMILCIHAALKWLGYDEVFKCDFLRDLREVDPRTTPRDHEDLEMEVLKSLSWDLS